MDSNSTTKRAKNFGKLAATLVGALGLYVIGAMLLSVWRMFHSYDSIGQMLLSFVFAAVPFAIGGYCLFTAYRIWFDISARMIRRLSLIAAVVFSLALFTLVETAGIFGVDLWELPWAQLISLSAVIVGGVFYLLCSKLLLRWLGLTKAVDWARREKAVRTFFSWLALFLFIALFSILMHLVPQGQGHTDAPKLPSSFWIVLVPAIAAYLVYKLGIYIALRNSCVTSD